MMVELIDPFPGFGFVGVELSFKKDFRAKRGMVGIEGEPRHIEIAADGDRAPTGRMANVHPICVRPYRTRRQEVTGMGHAPHQGQPPASSFHPLCAILLDAEF